MGKAISKRELHPAPKQQQDMQNHSRADNMLYARQQPMWCKCFYAMSTAIAASMRGTTHCWDRRKCCTYSQKPACKMLHATGNAGWHASHIHEALMLVEQNKMLVSFGMQLAADFQWRWALRAGRHVNTLFSAAKASFSSSASCCMLNWKLYHRTWTHSRLTESFKYFIYPINDPKVQNVGSVSAALWQSLCRPCELLSWQQAPSSLTSDAGIYAGDTNLG